MNSPYSLLKSTARKVRTMPYSCCVTDKRYFFDLPNYLNSSAICTGCHAWLNKTLLFAGAKTAVHSPNKLLTGYSPLIFLEQESHNQKESIYLLFCLLLMVKLEQSKNMFIAMRDVTVRWGCSNNKIYANQNRVSQCVCIICRNRICVSSAGATDAAIMPSWKLIC